LRNCQGVSFKFEFTKSADLAGLPNGGLPTLAKAVKYDRSSAGLKIHAFLIHAYRFWLSVVVSCSFGQVAISSTVGKMRILANS